MHHKVIWEKEQLEQMINEGRSYCEIGRLYNVSNNAVKKAAIKLGIKLKPRRKINPNETFNKGNRRKYFCLNCGKELDYNSHKINKYCSFKCQHEYSKRIYISKWLNGEISGVSKKYILSQYIRNFLLERSGYKCELCGWGEINQYSKKIPLEIHHIDGNHKNNNIDNLQVLCPNCHSLTNSYKNLNKNNGKIYRR